MANLDVAETLEEIREEYATAVRSGERGQTFGPPLSFQRLRDMQSSLYSIIVNLETSQDPKEAEQCAEAVVLYNATSSVMREAYV